MMPILGTILGSAAGELIKNLGNVVDKFVTTKSEKEQANKELQKVIFNHQVSLEQELTKRQQADMASDSWLSKNVRPMALVFLTVMTVALAYLTIFYLQVGKSKLMEPWLTLLTTLLSLVYTFYFGSRGFEKITNMIMNKNIDKTSKK